jgi:hypothetical protein
MNYQSFIDKIRSNPKYNPKNSQRWFADQIRKVYGTGNIPENKMFQNEGGKVKTSFTIGNMIFFSYDPKLKEKLPYYDRFPLVFPFNKDQHSFTGLNLHYLPPALRLALMWKLMTIKGANKTDDVLKLSWSTLSNFQRFPGAQLCVKKYLFDHVRSRYIVIPQESWITAAMLPADNFQKASNQKVWSKARGLANVT